ncbi:hypothetical protein SAMN05720762_101140 [Fibrobacter sp. UWH4]|nr:hypothetical protein SAMN05720762_101140 [Fibrobacter sp. UWH4]
MYFTLEWYQNQFLIILTKKMGLEDSDALSPLKLYEFVKQKLEIHTLLVKFFTEYKAWYDFHLGLESKRISLDTQYLIKLSDLFKQTRQELLKKS